MPRRPLLRVSKANLIIIKPKNNNALLSIRELIHYRDLLYFLTKKNFIIKYKQTLIGVTWAIIQPVMQMLVFSVLFGKFAGIPSDNVPYPIFVYSALLPWVFFANSMSACNNAIINHAGLLNKVYFPRIIIPLSAIGSQLIDFGLAFIILIGIMVYYQFSFTVGFLLIIPLLILTLLITIGFGTLIAALSGIYRDFRHIIPFLLSIWMFLTPVIYPQSIIGPKWKFLIQLNPMTGIVSGFRSAILNRPLEWPTLGISLLLTGLFFSMGIYYFNRSEHRFADVV